MYQQMKSEGSTVELEAGGFTDAWDDLISKMTQPHGSS